MSGLDERQSTSCNCEKFIYWAVEDRNGKLLGYLNDEKHPDIKEGHEFGGMGVIGRVNVAVNEENLNMFISKMGTFTCIGCGRVVNYRNNEDDVMYRRLSTYLKSFWDRRTYCGGSPE